jgi:hypothetical protein
MGLYVVEGVEEKEKSRHACGTAENTYLVIPLAWRTGKLAVARASQENPP